ncbi:MAG TPA: acyloxyacyl hydrolase [Albitalea sp.]
MPPRFRSTRTPTPRIAIALWLLAGAALDAAAGAPLPLPSPSAMYALLGVARGTNAATAGGWWDGAWRLDRAWGSATVHLEVSLGHWSAHPPEHGAEATTSVTQFGITPVVRLHPRGSGGWFVEGGIGVNMLSPHYRNGDKRFSTSFNFGDHLAVGRHIDPRGEHELSLRLQHFSNAGIERPNPGEDFLQLRYLRRF